MRISNIDLEIIQDSRGENTLQATMTSDGMTAVSSVPAGKSKGKFEVASIEPSLAKEKIDNIQNELLNTDFNQVSDFDNFLIGIDGTPNKANLGGNLILVLSIGFTKLLAKMNNLQTYELIAKIMGRSPVKFPYLYMNLIGGGLHAKDSVPFQEQILVAKFKSPTDGLNYAKNVVEKLRADISKNFGEIRTGDEGTFSIKSDDPSLGLEVLSRNIDSPEVSLALDVAASSFYTEGGTYKIGNNLLDDSQMLSLYEDLSNKFSLLSIEDPFAEDDKEGFKQIYKKLKDKIWIIGDDLTVTNKNLLQNAIDNKEVTGLIIKPNQIGSVSETIEAIQLAQQNNLKTIVSHRSGETNDDFIADLVFGSQADGLKSGAPTQPQRLAKYNRLIEIEKSLNKSS